MQGVSLERGQSTGSAGAPRSRFVSPCRHRSWLTWIPLPSTGAWLWFCWFIFWAGAIVWYSTHLCLTTSPISCTPSYWSSPSQPRSSPGPSGSPGCSSPSPSPAHTWAASRASPATSRASSGRTSWCTTCPPPSTTCPRLSSRRTRPSCSATRRPTSRRQRGSSCRPIPRYETWVVGWIQACTQMEFYNTYGDVGMWVPHLLSPASSQHPCALTHRYGRAGAARLGCLCTTTCSCTTRRAAQEEHLCTQQVNCARQPPSLQRPPTDSVPVTLAPK